jgi:uncharacterized RDD family membrane protein YckC
VTMDQSGQGGPPSGQPPAPQPPPPPQGWQSTPQPPGPPPQMGGQPSGLPSWTSNLTAQGTIPGPGGVALADAPNRFIAAFIDFFILGIVGFILNAITTPILGDEYLGFLGLSYKGPSLVSTAVSAILLAIISGGYFIYMWSRMGGATVGMRVLKLSVRDATTGGPVSQQQAINRWLLLGAPWALYPLYAWSFIGWIIWLAVLVYYIYLIITIAQDPGRQGFHDKYAKTVVAKG